MEKSEKSLIDSELKQQIREDLQIDEFSLEEQCRNAITLTQKYFEMYYSRKRVLASLKLQLDQLHGSLFKKYRFGGMPIKVNSATDANILINTEDEYIKLRKNYDRVQELVDFLADAIKQFKDRNWHIKNILEVRKLDET